MMHAHAARAALAGILCAATAGCARTGQAGSSPATESASMSTGQWRTLFGGTDLSAWRGYQMDTLPSGWQVADGEIIKSHGAADLITRDQFANFELTLDWKIATGGNAGIFYRGTEEYDHIYWSAPEYQLLDDANAPDGKNRLTSAASAYALYPATAGVVKPAGEWNSTRIIVNGAHVEHWLNGQKVVEYELWSPDWAAKVAASKFKDWPHYGLAHRGYIGIQGDHNGRLELRDIRIRELP